MLIGESIAGFIYRFYDLNQMDIPLTVRSVINKFYEQQLSPQDLFYQLEHLIGPIDAFTEYKWLQDQFLLRLKSKNLTVLTSADFRYCPKCINECAVQWVVWNLPMFTACPKHHCQLVFYCYICHRPLTWKSIGNNWCCQCKTAIKDIKTTNATALQLKLSQIILNAHDSPQSLYKKEKRVDGNQASYQLKELYEALEWVYFFRLKVTFVKYTHLKGTQLKALNTINKARFKYKESKFLFNANPQKLLDRILAKLAINELRLSTILMKLRLLKIINTEQTFLQRNRNVFTDSFIALFQTFIKEHSNQIHNELTTWVIDANPDIAVAKQVSLNQLVEWWRSVTDGRVISDKEHKIRKFRNDDYADRLTALIGNILKKLILASQWVGSEEIYQKLLIGYFFPLTLRSQCAPLDWLKEILIYLSGLEIPLLEDLNRRLELAELIWKDAQIA